MTRRLTRIGLGLFLVLAFTALAPNGPSQPAKDQDKSEVGRSYKIPYRLTDTNHFLVRVRINGKGPFNFLVDTGAPALYVSTDTAKSIGLKPAEDDFWTPIDRLDFEGGAGLKNLKARVEDPFQLVGMNALGLPGASIDGILGFTMLARYRMEIDLTSDRMTWTLLDFEPKDPPVPDRKPGNRGPAEMQAMNALGPIAKIAAAFVGKQPEEKLIFRGFLGVELAPDAKEDAVRVTKVLPGSPAEKAGLKAGDSLLEIGGDEVPDIKAARLAVMEVEPGDKLKVKVRRAGGAEPLEITIVAGEGV